jgi:NitT/TauT family transport system ATP-binding protein
MTGMMATAVPPIGAAGAPPAIAIDGIAMTYSSRKGDVHALAETSLAIPDGQFMALLGPSGCGKSTLLRIVAGLLTPSSGRVLVSSRQVQGPQTSMGIVFQSPILLEWLDVLGNVLLQAAARPIDRRIARDRADALLDRVGLASFATRRPSELSGGMQQRVALCRALLHDPDVLLMDEPFGALDALTRDQMCLDLQKLWTGGDKTVLFVTHDIAEAVFLSDRVVVMAPSPGRVDIDLPIDLPRPRRLATRDTDAFFTYCRTIRRAFEQNGILHETD